MLEMFVNIFGRTKPPCANTSLSIDKEGDEVQTENGFVILGQEMSLENTTTTEKHCVDIPLPYSVQPSSSRCGSQQSGDICGSSFLDGVPFMITAALKIQDEISNVVSGVFRCIENLNKYNNDRPWKEEQYNFSMERSILNEMTNQK
ncbi:uncharacterized protein LOC143246264 isoform X2 [Tachypleus tridentatus]|uniref:uncharacterized protein LOC143246264 isoform X2 n=1 Tax=Tachypleus tridentatus TaxID=6853 RepID=UPI003FD63F7A